MSTPKAWNISHPPRHHQQDTNVRERASTPTSDSDNDSTRAQLGKRHRITKSDSNGAGLQPSVTGPNRLNFSDADDISSQVMRSGGIKDDEDDYLGDGPEVLQGRGYPASRSVSRPQQSSKVGIQGYPSSAHTPYQAFERSPSPWRQPPIGYASGQTLPYSAGYSTFNRAFTPSDRSAMGTTGHPAPHHHTQYPYPSQGYPVESNYAVPSFSSPYQPTSQHFLPPGSQEVNQGPTAGLADRGYDSVDIESDLSTNKKKMKRRDTERSASPDRGPELNRIMRSPSPVPNYNYGGSKPYQSASNDIYPSSGHAPKLTETTTPRVTAIDSSISRPSNATAFSTPDEVYKISPSGRSIACPPSEVGVSLSLHSPSIASSTEHQTAPSLPDSPSKPSYALPVADLLSDLSLIENEVLRKGDFITQWQEAMGARQDTTEGITIQMIYHACMECYHAMLPSWYTALEGKDAVKHTLYRNHILLRDWGASYGVLDGQLDQLPKEAEDITDTILLFLTEISTILISSKTMKSTLKSITDEFRNSKVDRPGVEC
jgi:hypothetical protein